MLEWLLSMWKAGLIEQISKTVLPTLGWGALLIGGIGAAKYFGFVSGPFWSKIQLAVLVYTVLTICWDGYWVLHPSKEKVQWQRETNEYGLY